MRPIAFNDRALVIGKTTSGKSTIARFVFAQMTGARRICVNVKGEEKHLGVPPVYTVDAIDAAAPVVDFIPTTTRRELYAELYQWILDVGGPTFVWLDEGFGPTNGNYAPDPMLLVQQQGARRQIGHLVCSQRPVDIAVPLRTEAEHIIIVVPPISYDDLGALAREIAELDGAPCGPRELRELLRSVQRDHGDYSSVWWDRGSGELTVLAPLDSRWVDAPLQHPAPPRPQPSTPALDDVDVSDEWPTGPESEVSADA